MGLRRVGNDGTERLRGPSRGSAGGTLTDDKLGAQKISAASKVARHPTIWIKVTQLSVATGAVRQCFDTEQRARISSAL